MNIHSHVSLSQAQLQAENARRDGRRARPDEWLTVGPWCFALY
jgi:hypothetical protein